ncbi:hypothetical protein RF11_08172 [Thelohanellus kitauei]|uniref:Uncharacterized protein n=1 Tax=Thelohanellus kitauei TaxID=669202 RepID=A0A0C2N054_THEKT|nr:hypothetical protein RF11_08172 [Thelohanellus kitauei]
MDLNYHETKIHKSRRFLRKTFVEIENNRIFTEQKIQELKNCIIIEIRSKNHIRPRFLGQYKIRIDENCILDTVNRESLFNSRYCVNNYKKIFKDKKQWHIING